MSIDTGLKKQPQPHKKWQFAFNFSQGSYFSFHFGMFMVTWSFEKIGKTITNWLNTLTTCLRHSGRSNFSPSTSLLLNLHVKVQGLVHNKISVQNISKLSVLSCICNHIALQRLLQVQGHPELHSKFQALGALEELLSKTNKKQNTLHQNQAEKKKPEETYVKILLSF